MGDLVVDQIDFNSDPQAAQVIGALRELAQDIRLYRNIRTKNGKYFEAFDGHLPSQAGWYVLLVDDVPVYVGTTDNLNQRLNSDSGSLDNFAKRNRPSDPERNFVKKFNDAGVFAPPRAWVVTENELCVRLSANSPLSKLDRGNVEKFINLNRGFLKFALKSPIA